MPWIPSLKNHLWWSAATCNGDEDQLIEKWQSASKHVTNQHDWGNGRTFQHCAHEEITAEDQEAIKWLTHESPSHVELNKVLHDTKLANDIKKLYHF